MTAKPKVEEPAIDESITTEVVVDPNLSDEVESDLIAPAEPKEPEGTAAEDDETKKETPKWLQDRINKAVKKQREAEREADKVRQDRDHWRTEALEQGKKTEQQVRTVEPKENDFDTYEEFLDAKLDYRTKQIEENIRNEVKSELTRKDQEFAQRSNEVKFDKGREKYTDFDEIALDPSVPYSQAMADAVFEAENTEDVSYYLGQHLDIADRISRLSPISAAREIGKIEAQLSLGQQRGTQTKTITNAPTPISPVGGSGTVRKLLKDMTHDEYVAAREAGQIE